MSHSGKNGGIKKVSESDFRFEPPPEAPVFCPTEEEWKDPLGFIRSVRAEAERWGICKIRPPPAWQPPFALDVDRFAFTPRIQRLNELEANTRVKLNFLDSIAKFWELQGSVLKIPVLERRALDLCALHRLVASAGGHEEVTAGRRWSRLATRLGFSHGAGALLRGHYMRILYPYDVFQLHKPEPLKSETSDEVDEKPSTSVGMRRRRPDTDLSEVKPDVVTPELRRLQFFGAGPKMAGFVATPPDPFDPLSKYACLTCGSGGAEESMLLCDGCDDSYHTFCLTPPLSAIPAGDWRCPRCVALEVSKPQEAFGFEQARREYTLQQFGEMADEFKCAYFNMPVHRVSPSAVEAEFWRVVSSIDEDVTVEYGADLHTMDHGSGFPTRAIAGMHPVDQAYADSPWNLNNLPTLPGSVLAHINADISGMKVPWMYVGMCFAAFCWHNEDHWSYSINYLHWGEPKTWYGVSGRNAEAFERTMRAAAPELFQSQPDLLHQLVTIMNPNILTAAGVPVCRTDQHCGEFVVTFPRAYHAGFNQGYNFAEAVNFAPADWLAMGRECVAHYSNLRRFCVFAHDELVVKMAANHAELDLNEAAAAYQDMRTMVSAERTLRKALLEWGVKAAKRQELESLPDDARQCHACKTTCFLSAVTCTCSPGQLVCLRHYDRLCACPPKAHTLRYRHTLDELPALLTALASASGAWDEWTRKVRAALEPSARQRLTLGELQALADEARRRRFPGGALLTALEAQIKQADTLVGIARKVTGESPTLRVSPEELRELHTQFTSLPCAPLPEAEDLAALVTETNDAALKQPKQEPVDVEDSDAWLARANAALTSSCAGRRDAVLALLAGADLLPAHSEEVADALAALRAALDRADDVERRAEVVLAGNAAVPIEMHALRALLDEALKAPTSAVCLEKLRSTYRAGRAFSREATQAMRGGELLPYYDALRRLVSRGAALPVRLRALPELRKRMAAARKWKLDAANVFLPEPADPDQLMFAIAPKTVFGVAALNLPPAPAGPPTVGGVKLGGGGAEGGAVQKAFRDAAALELRLIRKLANPAASVSSSPVCTCRMLRGRGPVAKCTVCCEYFHHDCLEPALIKNAAFVCAGCCRTMRPTLKPVLRLLVALRPLSVRLPEGDALQSLADRALGWQDRARNLLSSAALLKALLQEPALLDHASDPKLGELNASTLRDSGAVARIASLLDSSDSTQPGALRGTSMSTARDLLREGLLLEVTLDECRILARLVRPPETAKRPRSPRSPARAAKGRRRTSNVVYPAESDSEETASSEPPAPETASTGDEEFCAAADCAGPQVHWVQCDSRCKRWYHLACVGLAEMVIKEDDEFFCPSCRLGDPLQILEGENGEDADSVQSSPSEPAEM